MIASIFDQYQSRQFSYIFIFLLISISPFYSLNTWAELRGVPLAQHDLKAISSLREEGPRAFDRKHKDLFKKVFGGYTAEHIRNFIEERIRVFLDEEQIKNISPEKFTYPEWLNASEGNQHQDKSAKVNESKHIEPDYSYVGTNDSVLFWALGRINRVTPQIKTEKNTYLISLENPILVLGPGYAETIPTVHGKLHFPTLYRIGKLIHEARHSDCDSESIESQLPKLKETVSYEDLRNKLGSCGFLHATCDEKYSDLNGMTACESLPWGPYSLETIFFDAIRENFEKGTKERADFDKYFEDAKRRLTFDYEKMMQWTPKL